MKQWQYWLVIWVMGSVGFSSMQDKTFYWFYIVLGSVSACLIGYYLRVEVFNNKKQ